MNNKMLFLISKTLNYISHDKDFIDEYNKKKRLNNFSYYAEDSVLDYLCNFDLLDKEYQDICHLKLKYRNKFYLIDLDTIFTLFEECLKVVG